MPPDRDAAPDARPSGPGRPLPRDAQLFAWLLYDWANSAYVTTVAVAVLPAYFAAAVVPADGWPVLGARLSATTLWGWAVSGSALAVFLLAPFLGAVADYGGLRRRFLALFCLAGSAAATLLGAMGPGDVAPTLALFIIAQIGFTGANVFYDAFLPHVAAPYGPGAMDRISGRGFAWGYAGGGLQFAASLALIAAHDAIGISEGRAAQIAMTSAGLWWGVFSLWTLARLREPGATPGTTGGPAARPGFTALARHGFARMRATTRAVLHDRPLLVFLAAFLFYNDGIQTIISMATIYGKQELRFSTATLMATLLMIQVVAVAGAEIFSRLAARLDARRALMAALVGWCAVSVYGYLLTRPWEYFLLGAAVGVVMGGSQALSRSLFAAMIPADRSAELFGYFSVVNKFSSIAGPALFAGFAATMGTARPAILALSAFFILGLVLLAALGRMKSRGEAGRGGTSL
jgi:UMF1 family MFS transporter